MTRTKQIRLLNEYIEKGLGDFVVFIIRDKWTDPESRKPEIRYQFTVSDLHEQFSTGSGFIYEAFSESRMRLTFKDFIKAIESRTSFDITTEFQDTYDKYMEEHPDYYKDRREKFRQFLALSSYMTTFTDKKIFM